MSVPKGVNNFKQHQITTVDATRALIQAELNDVKGRAAGRFDDIDAVVRHVAKVTGIHRTTLKRNTTYRRLFREYLSDQSVPTEIAKPKAATLEQLRAVIAARELTIRTQAHQLEMLQARLAESELG